MPSLSPTGRALTGCTGGGQGPAAIDGVPIAALAGELVSSARWLDEDRLIYGCGDRVEVCHLQTGRRTSLGFGANWIAASGGVWAARAQTTPPVYRDSFGRRAATWKPLAACARGVLALDYASGGQLTWLTADAEQLLLSSYIDRGDADLCDTPDGVRWCARLSATELAFGHVDESGYERRYVPASADLAFAWPYVVTWAHAENALVAIDLQTGVRIVVTKQTAFWPAAGRLADGTLRVAYARTAGEAPGDLVVTDIPARVFEAGSTPELPAPEPAVTAIRPWPQTLWIAPYHSHTPRPDWGDTADHIGNAILVTDAAEDAHRLIPLGLPLIITPDAYVPAAASLVVAYYVHAAHVGEAGHRAAAVEQAIRRHDLPDAPVIVYIDAREGWPRDQPAWLDPDRHWPSPQCYREPGEPLATFDAACRAVLRRLAGWGCQIVPTVHAYDRNGLGTDAEAVEALSCVRSWADLVPIIGLLPFCDRRQGHLNGRPIGGMALYPTIRAAVRALALANPRERPNRFDGWLPRFASHAATLRNKLGQSTAHPFLTPADKALLLSLLEDRP